MNAIQTRPLKDLKLQGMPSEVMVGWKLVIAII